MSLLRRSSHRRHRVSTPVITTWNPADKNPGISLSGGNLTASTTGAGTSNQVVRATRSGIAGRFFEVVFTTMTTNGDHMSGVALSNATQSLSNYPSNPNSVSWFGNGYHEGPGGDTGFVSLYAQSSVIGVRLNETSADFFKDGTLIRTFSTLPSGLLYPSINLIWSDVAVANYGASTFAYPPIGATGWDG